MVAEPKKWGTPEGVKEALEEATNQVQTFNKTLICHGIGVSDLP